MEAVERRRLNLRALHFETDRIDFSLLFFVFFGVGIANTATPFPTSGKHSDHLIKMSTTMTKCIKTETSMTNGYKKASEGEH